jgi:hypothetical protein
MSSLAHVITPGPDHGKVISFFAKNLNHGHTSHPATTPKSK